MAGTERSTAEGIASVADHRPRVTHLGQAGYVPNVRILVVHHGSLAPGSAPTTGGAVRAAQHVAALRGAGHEVATLHRDQDGPGGFTGPAHLRSLARRSRPDWVLCVAPEEASSLTGLAPLVVDLYAPRLLEAAWEGQQEDEARRALLAVDAADEVLFSNPRQRWFWLGVLGLTGWDLSREVGRIVPLATSSIVSGKRPKRPRVILGGHPWPWQDATDVLGRALRHLKGRAEIVSYGLPPMDGVTAQGLVSVGEWRTACAGATVALDRYAPHTERELALSFRQLDYLSAGLPIITDPWTPLADGVRAHRAGWVDESLEDALDAALTDDRRAGAASLAATYAPDATAAVLASLAPTFRLRTWSALRWSRQAAAAKLRSEADTLLREAAEAEVRQKRDEVDVLVGQLRALTSAVESLASSQADMAGFRRETVQVLGTRLAGQTGEAEALRRELAITRADLEKKELELAQVHTERDRLGGVLRRLKGEGR